MTIAFPNGVWERENKDFHKSNPAMNIEKNKRKVPIVSVLILIVNIIGAVAYFLLSHRISVLKETERQVFYDGIDTIPLAGATFPIVLCFFLIGFAYSIYAVAILIKDRNLKPLAFCGLLLALWIITQNITVFDGWFPKSTFGWRHTFPLNLLHHLDNFCLTPAPFASLPPISN